MKQETVCKKDRPLLTYAISKLNPEVFSHPVWLRFGRKEKSVLPGIVEVLINIAQELQDNSPSDACQVLLICAAYQNYAGRRDNALRTTQQALALAERNGLAREIIWATWGACAVCFQEDYYEQAARYLEYLQAGLSEQNEWILADFIAMVYQALLHPGSGSPSEPPGLSDDQSRDDLLSLTFDWLRQWGFSAPISGQKFETNTGRPTTRVLAQERLAQPSLLRSILSSVRSYLPGRSIRQQLTKDLPRLPGTSISSSVSEEPVSNVISHDFSPSSTEDELSGRATIRTAVIQMLGAFSLTIQDAPVKLPASRGLSLLKYLLFHHKQDTPREILMDIFWRDSNPEASRNNLNVAMHSMRQALRTATNVAVIRFEDGAYGLEPGLDIWLDVEEFERYIQEGRRLEIQNQMEAAVTKYEVAVNLYQGDFLSDSPYEGWTIPDRDRLLGAYLETLERISQIYFSQQRYAACIAQCQLILARDLCREDVHYRLMQCYSRVGQGPLALRQYQVCAEALRVELDVDPAPETTSLYEHIRHREPV